MDQKYTNYNEREFLPVESNIETIIVLILYIS